MVGFFVEAVGLEEKLAFSNICHMLERDLARGYADTSDSPLDVGEVVSEVSTGSLSAEHNPVFSGPGGRLHRLRIGLKLIGDRLVQRNIAGGSGLTVRIGLIHADFSGGADLDVGAQTRPPCSGVKVVR